jgi:hypothetical protein
VGVVVVVVVVCGTVLVVELELWPPASIGRCVVVVVGAAVPTAAGSFAVAFDAAAPCNGCLLGGTVDVVRAALACVPEAVLACLGEPFDDDVDVDVDAAVGVEVAVDVGAVPESAGTDRPEGSTPSALDADSVLPFAGLEPGALGGEPGRSAKDRAIATIPTTDVIPISVCRRRVFISHLNSQGRRSRCSSC